MSFSCQHIPPENSNLLHCIKDFWNSTHTVSKESLQRKCRHARKNSEMLGGGGWNHLPPIYSAPWFIWNTTVLNFKVPVGVAKSLTTQTVSKKRTQRKYGQAGNNSAMLGGMTPSSSYIFSIVIYTEHDSVEFLKFQLVQPSVEVWWANQWLKVNSKHDTIMSGPEATKNFQGN